MRRLFKQNVVLESEINPEEHHSEGVAISHFTEVVPMPDREIESNKRRVRWLVDKIWDGNIKIPDFQRPFVWDYEQVVKLLDSIYNDYPVGSILLWKTKEKLNSLRNIGGIKLPEKDAEDPINYVLDGQQRLSSLFAVLHHDAEEVVKETSKVGIEDYERFDIYFDLKEESFIHRSDLPDIKSNNLFKSDEVDEHRYFKINNMREPTIYREKARQLPEKYVEVADRLINKFENYEVPVVTVKGREKSEVGTIFERINNTGTDLNTLDLMIAWTWSSDFNLRQEIKDTLDRLDEKGFGELREKVILQCISAISEGKVSTDHILDSLKDPNRIEKKIDALKSSLGKTIDFLRNEFNAFDLSFLPSSFQIIPLVYFFSQVKRLNQYQSEKAKEWFWRTSFTSRYRDATNYRVHEDISFFEDLSSGQDVSLDSYATDVGTESFFSNHKFHKAASVTKAFILMLAKRNPKDLLSGRTISIEDTFSDDASSEYHHVFPREYLRSSGYEEKQINCLSNVCILSAASNREIGTNPPSEYLFSSTNSLFESPSSDKSNLKEILSSNLLPTDLGIYRENNFERFINERRKIMYKYFNKLI